MANATEGSTNREGPGIGVLAVGLGLVVSGRNNLGDGGYFLGPLVKKCAQRLESLVPYRYDMLQGVGITFPESSVKSISVLLK